MFSCCRYIADKLQIYLGFFLSLCKRTDAFYSYIWNFNNCCLILKSIMMPLTRMTSWSITEHFLSCSALLLFSWHVQKDCLPRNLLSWIGETIIKLWTIPLLQFTAVIHPSLILRRFLPLRTTPMFPFQSFCERQWTSKTTARPIIFVFL